MNPLKPGHYFAMALSFAPTAAAQVSFFEAPKDVAQVAVNIELVDGYGARLIAGQTKPGDTIKCREAFDAVRLLANSGPKYNDPEKDVAQGLFVSGVQQALADADPNPCPTEEEYAKYGRRAFILPRWPLAAQSLDKK